MTTTIVVTLVQKHNNWHAINDHEADDGDADGKGCSVKRKRKQYKTIRFSNNTTHDVQ